MKTNFLTSTVWVLAVSLSSMVTNAQSKPARESSTRGVRVNNDNGLTTIDYKMDGKSYRIEMKDDMITELYVDDKKIAEEDYGKYQETIEKIIVHVKKDKEKAEEDQKHALKNQQLAKLEYEKASEHNEQAEKYALQAEKQKQLTEIDQKRALEKTQEAKSNSTQSAVSKQQAEQYAVQAQKYKLQAERDQERATIDMKRAEKDKARSRMDAERAIIDAKKAAEDKETMESLLDDLVKEKVINDRDDAYSIELTETTLSVNGKKQRDELQRKFKANYLKNGKRINFSTRHYSIEK